MSRFPALGFDPAPGDPDELARLSRETSRAACEVDALGEELRRLTALEDWRGVAADSFRGALGRLPQQLEVASDAFGTVARRLSEWSGSLAELQAQGRAAERDAVEALARLRAARAWVPSGLPPAAGGPEAFIAHLQALQASQRAVDAAERALAEARSRGQAVQDRAREGASRVERAVRDAARSAPAGPGALRALGNSLVDGVRWLNRQAGEFVREHREVIAAVTDALSTAAFVAGFVPGAGTLLVFALGAAALAGTGALAAYADEKDAGDLALAAVGLGLGGAAAAAGHAAKAARAAETDTAVRHLPSMFSNGLSTGPRELGWRAVQLQPTLAGHAVGLVDTVSTARSRGLLPPASEAAPAGASPRVAIRHVEPGRLVPAPVARPAPVPVSGR